MRLLVAADYKIVNVRLNFPDFADRPDRGGEDDEPVVTIDSVIRG